MTNNVEPIKTLAVTVGGSLMTLTTYALQNYNDLISAGVGLTTIAYLGVCIWLKLRGKDKGEDE